MITPIISEMIPNNDPNWVVRENIVYYKYLVYIPILILKDDIYWVILDRRYTKAFLKMVFYLVDKGVDFKFKSKIIGNNKNESHNSNIRTYILLLEDKNIYKHVKTNKYPFNKILINYIKFFNCMDIFIEELNILKKEVLGYYHDYYSKINIYTIPNEEVRNKIYHLDRIIKIEYIVNKKDTN